MGSPKTEKNSFSRYFCICAFILVLVLGIFQFNQTPMAIKLQVVESSKVIKDMLKESVAIPSINTPMKTNGGKEQSAAPPLNNTKPRYFTADGAGHGHRDCRFSSPLVQAKEDNAARMNIMMGAWSRFTKLYGVQSWISHGTLLGWHCGKTMMDFDDDIDIEVTKEVFVDALGPLNQTVFEGRFLLDINPSGLVWHPFQPVNAIDGEFIDMSGGYKIDITAFGHRKITPVGPHQLGASDGHIMLLEDLFPLQKSTMDQHDVWVPHRPENLLQSEYGQKGVSCSPHNKYTFDGREWISPSMPSRARRSPLAAFWMNATPFWVSFSDRNRFATTPSENNALELNSQISTQLASVDVDNTVAPPLTASNQSNLNVIEFNIQRGTHWKRACELIRSEGAPDVIFLNEADWGMSRSSNEHVARRMAFELGLNYAWGAEFLELSPGDRAETDRAKHADDCPTGRRGVGFSGKVDALGYTGNAILSKYPLLNVTVSRSPGIGRLYGVKNDLTANGFELRLGGRMTLYATVVLPTQSKAHLGCFHHQMKWDQRFPEAFRDVGKQTLDGMRQQIDRMDPTHSEIFLLGGDGWGTTWCNDIGIPNLHEYTGGNWICGRAVVGSKFKRISSREVSDHDMFHIVATPN